MNARMMFVIAVAFFVAASSGCAARGVHRVSDLRTLATLCAEEANPGDVIEIRPGTYYLDTPKIEVLRSGTPDKPIIIRGVSKNGKRPVIDASKANVNRGIFYFEETTHDVILENLELSNAVGGGRPGKEFPRNAAACYILGSNITIRDCVIHHSENGLFSTHESDFVLVDGCDIGFNGRAAGVGEPHRTHSFYFNSKHQMVTRSYIHDSTDGENFKSRGGNNIFAYNWVDEELAYSLGVDSGNEENTLWLGNVAVKRTYEGINQGRLLGAGDGTGVARGTLVALNNTFITIFPRDLYLFTEKTSTTNVILMNNVFAGPGETFLEKNGKGRITGAANWIDSRAEAVPGDTLVIGTAGEASDVLTVTKRGEDPGFVDAKGMDFHLKTGSPLIGAGLSGKECIEAIRIVTQFSRSGKGVMPSKAWLDAVDTVDREGPALEPNAKATGATERKGSGSTDIGAYGYDGQK